MCAMHQPIDGSTDDEYTEGDVQIKPVGSNGAEICHVQEVGNPDAFLWFTSENDEITTKVKP